MSAAIKVTFQLLSEHAGVANLVADRIYPNVVPQGAGAVMPLIVMSGIGRVESPTQDDDSAIDTYRIQLDLFAEDAEAASGISQLTSLENQVRLAMARQTGYVLDVLVNGIQSAGEGDEYDSVLRLHRKRLDYQIRITR